MAKFKGVKSHPEVKSVLVCGFFCRCDTLFGKASCAFHLGKAQRRRESLQDLVWMQSGIAITQLLPRMSRRLIGLAEISFHLCLIKRSMDVGDLAGTLPGTLYLKQYQLTNKSLVNY